MGLCFWMKLRCRLLPSEMEAWNGRPWASSKQTREPQSQLSNFKGLDFWSHPDRSQLLLLTVLELMVCDLWGHTNGLMALIAWLVTMSQFSHAETIGHRPWQTEFWFGSNPKMRLGFYWGRWTCHPLWPVDTSWIDKFPVQSIYPAQTRFWKSYNENLTSGMLRTIAKDKIINKKWWRQRLTANVT